MLSGVVPKSCENLELTPGTAYAPFSRAMTGFVTTRHLVTHAGLIVRLFGLRAYLRCVRRAVVHRGRATFLSALCGPGQ